MMDAQLDDVRERGEPIAALWASEETIYGRFGYGLASLGLNVERRAERGARSGASSRTPVACGSSTTTRRCAPSARVYDRITRTRPRHDRPHAATGGRLRTLDDQPEQRRGGGPLSARSLERDGQPVGYALYRLAQEGSSPEDWKKTIRVSEAFGVDDDATRELWRFLLEIDWVDRIEGVSPARRPPAAAPRRPDQPAATAGVGRALAAARRRPTALAGAVVREPGRVTIEVVVRPAVSRQRRHLDDRRRLGATRTPRGRMFGCRSRRSAPPTSAASRSGSSRAPGTRRR